ncbi:hypothetical protein EUTSA_v100040360mg, partial [Eutrema salsugineum]
KNELLLVPCEVFRSLIT